MEGSGGSVVVCGGDPFYGTHIPDLHRSFVRFPPKSDAPRSLGWTDSEGIDQTALLHATMSQIFKEEIESRINNKSWQEILM